MQLINISNKLTKLLLALVLLLMPLFTTLILPNTAYAVENGKIVYTVVTGEGGLSDIYTMNPDGTNKTQLTNDGMSIFPSVSPDGTKIGYVVAIDGNYTFASMNIDGSNKQLSEVEIDIPEGAASALYWTQSGNKVYMINKATSTAIIMNPDGTDIVSSGIVTQIFSYSPDGSMIAYTDPNTFVSYVANANGSNPVQLSNLVFSAFPHFAPDGEKIFFGGSDNFDPQTGPTNPHIYSINTDGSSLVQIRFWCPGYIPVPLVNYSLDASIFKSVVVSSEVQDNYLLCSMNTDGTGEPEIIDIKSIYQGELDLDSKAIFSSLAFSSFSPDSSKLVFPLYLKEGESSQFDIFTMNTDGTNLTNLTNTPEQNEMMTYSNQSWARVTGTTSEEQSQPLTGTTSNSTPISLVLPGSATNAQLIPIASNTIPTDPSFTYPSGLTSFQFDTEQGATETITLYFDLPGDPQDYTARKYNTTTKAFTTIPNATITRTTYNNQSMLKLTYQITDGGDLDQDNTTNGTIVDPVGLAQTKTTAPDTGLRKYWLLQVGETK